MITPATGIKPIGLPADAQAAKFFAAQLRQFYLDMTTPFHQPGPEKNSSALTRTATNHTGWPLANMCGCIKDIRLPALQVIKCIMTRFLYAVYQFVPRCATGYFKIHFRGTNPSILTTYIASRISLPTHYKKLATRCTAKHNPANFLCWRWGLANVNRQFNNDSFPCHLQGHTFANAI